MNEECVAVDAVGSMPKLQLRVDRQVCAVRFLTWEDVTPRRPMSPTKHTQNPMAGKIRDDWWVRPSHGECRGSAWRGYGLHQPRFWIRVFLLLDRLPAKANEPCLPTHTDTHTHTHSGLRNGPTYVALALWLNIPPCKWSGVEDLAVVWGSKLVGLRHWCIRWGSTCLKGKG